MVVYLSVKIEEKEKDYLEKAVEKYSEKERLKYNFSERVRQILLKWADEVLKH